MIDERADGQEIGQLWDPAHVVSMKVRHEEVVDSLYTGTLRNRQNALRIARFRGVAGTRGKSARAGEACIDEQRLTGRRDDERRLPLSTSMK